MIIINNYNTNKTCGRLNCKIYNLHSHCMGKTKTGKCCNNKQMYSFYCSRHKDQSKCFYPKCTKKPLYNGYSCDLHLRLGDFYYPLLKTILTYDKKPISLLLAKGKGDIALVKYIITFL